MAGSTTRLSAPALLLRLAFPAAFIAGVLMLVNAGRETTTASEIIGQIHRIALARVPDRPPGGPMGPWWISAGRVDSAGTLLEDFKADLGRTKVAAKRARIVVDPLSDCIRIDLYDVVFARVDDPMGDGGLPIQHQESYHLGPIPWEKADIVPDAAASPGTMLKAE